MQSTAVGFKAQLMLIFYSLALSATVFIIVVLPGSSLLENIARLNSSNIYVAASSWDIPAFISLPCFLALIYALLLRLTQKATEIRIQRCVKVATIFALAAIVFRIPYGFAISHYMEAKGYSSCVSYTSPALMSPAVWVRYPTYCIENTGSVRRSLLEWIDSSVEAGKSISPEDLKRKAEQLLEEYDRKERETFPGVYR